MTNTTTGRKRGRPAKNTTRADEGARPRKRVPVHGSRDILTIVNGKDIGGESQVQSVRGQRYRIQEAVRLFAGRVQELAGGAQCGAGRPFRAKA